MCFLKTIHYMLHPSVFASYSNDKFSRLLGVGVRYNIGGIVLDGMLFPFCYMSLENYGRLVILKIIFFAAYSYVNPVY